MVRSTAPGMAKGALSKAESRKFVDVHPAAQSALPRNVDRSMFGHGAAAVMDGKTQGEVNSHMALSEQFLSGASVQRSERVIDWMDKLKDDSARFIQSRHDDLVEDELRATMYRSAISYLVDKIFGDLRWCAYEYNKVAQGTALQISSSILGEVTEVVRMNSKREAEETATFFRARLSNRRHCLLVRGGGSKIDFYIVPVSHVMAVATLEEGYAPVATLAVKLGESGVLWKLMNSRFKPESVEELSMWIFSEFVESTRRELAGQRD